MSGRPLVVYTQPQTAALLDFASLADALSTAVRDYANGAILSPERMVVPIAGNGVMLSMPATAADIAIHKLVNVQPANAERQLPTIHGQVSVYDGETGSPVCLLDGPEVTGRRTASVSMLAIRSLLAQPPTSILIIGTGTQAGYHLQAIHALYPTAQVWVKGWSNADTDAFCEAHRSTHAELRPAPQGFTDFQVVITLTTSTTPVYNEVPTAGKLVIGVGAFTPKMAEIGKTTLDGSDLYADDLAGVRHEAGDLIQAGVDWASVKSLAQALTETPDLSRPIVFKSVGTAAWDLAACRVAKHKLEQ